MSRCGGCRAGCLAAAAATLAALALLPAGALAARGPADGRPRLDVRDARAPVTTAQRTARAALVAKLGDQGELKADPATGGVAFVGRTDGFLTAVSSADPEDVVLGYVRANAAAFGLDGADLAGLERVERYRSFDGVTHLAWAQTADGVPSYDGLLRAHVTSDGRLINVSAPLVHDLHVDSARPALSAGAALAVAEQDALGKPATAPREGARLVVFASKAQARLAWRVRVAGEEPFVYDTVVDAATGEILARNSLTRFLANASVYDNHPGAAHGGVATTRDLDGPDGTWLDRSAGDTKLDGNNAHTYADVDDSDGADASEEVPSSGGGDFVYARTPFFPAGFNCPAAGCSWDPTNTPASTLVNNRQVTVQLHYFVNVFHDWLLAPPVGFDEASRNFEQVNSSGAPGAGDRLMAEASDGGGRNNANFTSTADGTSPRMQMYFTQISTKDNVSETAQSTAEDATIVFHEYTHGLTDRLVGNGTGLFAQQSGAMGEGWSDWYALDYLVAHGLEADTAASGELFEGAFSFAPLGVRTEATDCPLGAAAAVCPGDGSAGSGGYTYGDLGRIGAADVHDNGEIWTQTLWDLRNAVGSSVARGLITGGLRLSPSNPSFIVMRNAILQADQAVYGGDYHDAIWTVFAARGMGAAAIEPPVGGANANGGATDDFTLPPGGLQAAGRTIADPLPGGDGDGIAEPGETITLVQRLRNGFGTVTGITGTLTSGTPGVTFPQATATWPTMAGGKQADSSAPALRFTIPASHPCGVPVSLSLQVHSDQGAAAAPTIAISVPTGMVGAPEVFTKTAPVAIPDNAPAGVTSTINVPAGASISDVVVRIADLDHTFVGDLRMTLRGPDGTTATLMNRPGAPSGGNDFTNTVLDDEASSPIAGIGSEGDFTGRFSPDQALSAFDGRPRAGIWTLTVIDTEAQDTGTLRSWALEFAPAAVCAFAGAQEAPVAATLPVTATGETTASLAAQVNPGGLPTAYTFEYGTSTSFGAITPVVALDDARALEPVGAALTGLAPGTTYLYRVVASNALGTTFGAVRSFATTASSGPPIVTTGTAVAVGAGGATLAGTVDAHGAQTAFTFEYGTSLAFGSITAVDNAGSAPGVQSVSLPVGGLAPDTTYLYRIVATNANGTASGPVRSFVTAAGA